MKIKDKCEFLSETYGALSNFIVVLFQMKTNITIDPGAGPCFGVQRAIQMAEDLLDKQEELRCLGDLIHNNEEIKRLEDKGLRTISHCQLVEQSGKKILIRAHGEPPSTFRIANNYDLEIIDATCPIVKKLQEQLVVSDQEMIKQKGQIILFGDIYHPEVIALKAYTKGEFHIVRNVADLEKLSSKKPTVIFSQTTKLQVDYANIVNAFHRKRKAEKTEDFPLEIAAGFCKQVAKRDEQLLNFLTDKDMLIFVSGRKSSNGNYLFKSAKKSVKSAHFISNPTELETKWFKRRKNIGISGAASTPFWLLENVRSRIEEILSDNGAWVKDNNSIYPI